MDLVFFGIKILLLVCWVALWNIYVSVSLSNYPCFCFTGFYGNPKAELTKFS